YLGGTVNLLLDFVPHVLIYTSASDRSTVHRRIREIFPTHRLNLLTLKAGENFPISSDVSGRILFPPADFTAATADDQAFVVQLSIKRTKILFVSVSVYATEKSLLAWRSDLRSDFWFKAKHHSEISGSDVFL